jgi:predicted RNA methylase
MLKPQTILQRVPNVQLTIDSTNVVQLIIGGQSLDCGPHALAVLEAFAQPASFEEVLAGFKARGAQQWIDVAGAIVNLYKAGVLRDCAHADMPVETIGFGSVPVQLAMLNDRRRTAAFLAGVAEVVRAGDIVVDIGTGMGVLAVAAAKAGAAHVYAIESGAMATVARDVFAMNGVADRITVVQGWSTEVQLPVRADVLVSEIIGDDPWGERVLEITRDARKRLLKPAARMVPAAMQVFGLPVAVPHTEWVSRTVGAETLENWHHWYGIDFRPLADMARQIVSPQWYVKSSVALGWTILSEPVLLADIDFKNPDEATFDRSVSVTAIAGGECNGLLVYFDLTLSAATTLSTHPNCTDTSNWRSPVFLFGEPLRVKPGDRFMIHYQAGVNGRQSEARLSR